LRERQIEDILEAPPETSPRTEKPCQRLLKQPPQMRSKRPQVRNNITASKRETALH
jgi:hypothetical protein